MQKYNCERDNIYLNIDHTRQISYGLQTLTQLFSYNTTKDVPIVDRGEDYYLAVVSFSIPLNAVPVTICPIRPNQGDANLTTLRFGLDYNGNTERSDVMYVSQFNTSVVPAPVQNANQQVVTRYYFVYTYSAMLAMFNTSLKALWVASGLNAIFPDDEPYFIFNETTQLISLIIPRCMKELVAPAVGIPVLRINDALFQYIDGLPWFVDSATRPDELFNILDISSANLTENNGYTPYASTPALPIEWYKLTQTAFQLQYWNPITQILFKSIMLPVSKEYITLKNKQTGLVNEGYASSAPILTSFTVAIEKSGDGRSIAFFNPKGQYKLIDIVTKGPIFDISLSIEWIDNYGNSFPLEVVSYKNLDVKLAFVRKSLYKNEISK